MTGNKINMRQIATISAYGLAALGVCAAGGLAVVSAGVAAGAVIMGTAIVLGIKGAAGSIVGVIAIGAAIATMAVSEGLVDRYAVRPVLLPMLNRLGLKTPETA